jgi:hypothetical protein
MGIDTVHFAVDLEGRFFGGDKGVLLERIDIGVAKSCDMRVGNIGGTEVGMECSCRGKGSIDDEMYLAGRP